MVKPGNIMIKKGCYTTKLCDLGISFVKSMVAATTTVFGNVGGSPAYIDVIVLFADGRYV